jgi:hypothetical protein
VLVGTEVSNIGVMRLFPEGNLVSTCLFAGTKMLVLSLGDSNDTSCATGLGSSREMLAVLFVSFILSMAVNNSGFSTICVPLKVRFQLFCSDL